MYDVHIWCECCDFEETVPGEDADGYSDGCPDCGADALMFENCASGSDDTDDDSDDDDDIITARCPQCGDVTEFSRGYCEDCGSDVTDENGDGWCAECGEFAGEGEDGCCKNCGSMR